MRQFFRSSTTKKQKKKTLSLSASKVPSCVTIDKLQASWSYQLLSQAGSAEPWQVWALSIFAVKPLIQVGRWGWKCQTAPLSCRGLEKETAAASRSHGPLKSEWRGLGIRCRLRELLLPETRKLIYIRIGWRLRPLRVLWIWGIKHNGFHVGLSFTTSRLHRGTVCSLECRSDLFCSWKKWHAQHQPEPPHTRAHTCTRVLLCHETSAPGEKK